MKNKILKKIEMNNKPFKVSDSFYESSKIFLFNNKKGKKPQKWIKIFYKTYPRLDRIKLPSTINTVKTSKNANIFKLILTRRSRRKFSNKNISLEDLSKILHYSTGVTKIKNHDWNSALRAYPSAGARFPLEIYIFVNNIDDIKKGIYHYNVKEHSLEVIKVGNYKKTMKGITNQKISAQSNFNIVISAIFDRTRIKYGDRGYHFPFIEAGHLAQNCYLISESLNLNCCTIGGFIDDKINNLLDFADSCEKTIYIISIGK